MQNVLYHFYSCYFINRKAIIHLCENYIFLDVGLFLFFPVKKLIISKMK